MITEIKNSKSKIDTDNKSYLHINFKDKALSLEIIQPEGKKINGHNEFSSRKQYW